MYTEQSGASPARTVLILLVNALIGFFFGLCLLVLFSAAIWGEWLPETMIGGLPVVSALLACALSAYLSGKCLGRGLLLGVVHGLVQYAISYLMGLLVFLRLSPNGWNIILLLCCVFGGILGGVLSATRIRFKKYRVK